MARYCLACGASNANNGKVCCRCGKSLLTGNMETERNVVTKNIKTNKGSKSVGIIFAIIIVALLAVVLLSRFVKMVGSPKLDESEVECVLSKDILVEKNALESIFEREREHEPVTSNLEDISQDGNSAVVTYKYSAEYIYARHDVICRYNLIYIDGSDTWKQGQTEKEYKWDYHDLEGVWQETDWSPSMVISDDSGPSKMTIKKVEGGYEFTASENWIDDTQDEQIVLTMKELNEDDWNNQEGDVRLFPKGYQSESSFQCYNLSPEEGITDMEKIE